MSDDKESEIVREARNIGWAVRWVIAAVSHIAEHVGMVLLCVMVLVVSYTCFTRYVLSFTPSWGEEVALLCMVWFGFMAIALGVRDDGHIGVTVFDRFYPPKLLWALNLFKYVAIGAFSLFMIYYGKKMADVGAWNKFPGIGITSYWLYIIVPASGVAILVYCLQKFYEHFMNKNDVFAEGEDA